MFLCPVADEVSSMLLKCSLKETNLDSGMVNFMCQLGWDIVSRYVVKHYSVCFVESVSRLN